MRKVGYGATCSVHAAFQKLHELKPETYKIRASSKCLGKQGIDS